MDHPALEKAIFTLQTALHARTADTEALAAIYGFRRVAKGETLTDICLDMFSKVENAARFKRWRAMVEATENENQRLKGEIDEVYGALEVSERKLGECHRRTEELEAQLALLAPRVTPVVEEPDAEISAMDDEIVPVVDEEIVCHDAPNELEDIVRDAPSEPEGIVRDAEPEAIVPNEPEGIVSDPPNESAEPDHTDTKVVKKIKWTDVEKEFLARLYEADPTVPNKVFACRCSEEFNRTITNESIAGAIDRLRKTGRLPKYREGHERQPKAAKAAKYEGDEWQQPKAA